MVLEQVMDQVNFVSNASGRTTAVQVQIEIWEQIIAHLRRTLSVPKPVAEPDTGWDAFLSLADDAQPGSLENPSVQHDAYLYGQST